MQGFLLYLKKNYRSDNFVDHVRTSLLVTMNNCVDDSSPFLIKFDGTRISLNLGDTECTFTNKRNPSDGSLSFFLPGKAPGELICAFSALFDGSLHLSKESNAAPEIFVNGSRIPAATNICIQSGDSIVIGSIENSFIADLNDADTEVEEKRAIKSEEEILSEVNRSTFSRVFYFHIFIIY